MKNRKFKKGLAIVLALVMVFAMTATAFADTNDTVSVTVRFDTRSYDLDDVVMKTTSNADYGTSPVVTTSVNIASGSTVLDVLNAVATSDGLEIRSKQVQDYYDSTLMHTAITSIAKVGEYYIDNSVPSIKSAFLTTTVPTTVDSRGYYYESGWIYGLKTGTGDEYFPGSYMDSVEVTDGMTVTFHYSVTGAIDVNTGTWTSDYSNPDVTMWNLYDKVAALGSDEADAILEYINYAVGEGSTVEAGNTTGLTAYYFSHNGLTEDNEFIPLLRDALETYQNA